MFPVEMILNYWAQKRVKEVADHQENKDLPSSLNQVRAVRGNLLLVQFAFLFFKIRAEKSRERRNDALNNPEEVLYVVLWEEDDDEEALDGYFDDCFAKESSSEEGPEGDQEMATGKSGKVEEWIGDGCEEKNNDEGVLLKISVKESLSSINETSCFSFLLDLIFEFLELSVFLSRDGSCSCHEVGRKLSNGCAKAPERSFKDDCQEHIEDTNMALLCSNLLAGREVLEAKFRRLEWRHVFAFICCHGYFGDVRTEVEDEGVKSCAQANAGSNSKAYPPQRKEEDLFNQGLMLGMRAI